MIHSNRCLSGSTLKLIAIISMAIDHFAASILYYGILPHQSSFSVGSLTISWLVIYEICRFIGRIAFPIFCFLMVEGFFYTRSRRNYALRLLLFALLSELPFDLALLQRPWDISHQNVFFTLWIGFLTIWGMENSKDSHHAEAKQALFFISGCALAYLLRTDYDYLGILLIVVLYCFRSDRKMQCIVGCVSLLWEAPACLAFLPISCYNGKRGLSVKYFFYLFYPMHLILYWIVLQKITLSF